MLAIPGVLSKKSRTRLSEVRKKYEIDGVGGDWVAKTYVTITGGGGEQIDILALTQYWGPPYLYLT